MMYWMGSCPFGTVFGTVVWFVIFGLLIYGLYLFFKHMTKQANHGADAINVLKERLARGEINEEEYEKLKALIKKD